MYVRSEIKASDIEAAEIILEENGVADADLVLREIGLALLDEDIYAEM